MITDIVSILAFAGFLLAILAVRLAQGRTSLRKPAVDGFVLYVLAVTVFAGLTQRDLWPFSAWSLVAGDVPSPWNTTRMVVVDAEGREHRIDARAVEPLSIDELRGWLLQEFPRLDSTAQDRVLADLLNRVNTSRGRVAAGAPAGTNARFLGRFTAPLFLMHPHRWNTPQDVPEGPFTAIRYYEETWDLSRHMRGEDAITRRLLRAWPPQGSR